MLKYSYNHYPFGSPISNRSFSASSYRYGFNGKENDRETVGTGEGTQDYGLRIYNPALGKFLSVDPLSSEYPWNSTYAFAENDVIRCTDLDGAEKNIQITSIVNGKTVVETIPYGKLFPGKKQGSMGSGTAWFHKDPKSGKYQFQQYIPSFYETKLGKLAVWLGIKDKNNYSEAEGNGNLSDKKKKTDIKGDGRLNPKDSPDNPYKDPTDPTGDGSSQSSVEGKRDADGWSVEKDAAGNVDKKVDSYNLYKNAETGDTVEIFNTTGMEHITDLKSENGKEAIKNIKDIESKNKSDKD